MGNPAVIVVSHDSEQVLPRCLNCLEQQDLDLDVIVVDSGSASTSYLEDLQQHHRFTLLLEENIGFARANNLGLAQLRAGYGAVLFLNPDAFLPAGYIELGLQLLADNPEAAMIAGTLLGYDCERDAPTGLVDSTGIWRSWYGRWYDRDQGAAARELARKRQELPAVCGAAMLVREAAVASCGPSFFDPAFWLYKEDIEVSIRLRKAGWTLLYDPRLSAYHCRGWQRQRRAVPRALRLQAARSELLLCRKHPSIHIGWALAKLALVRLLNI